MANKFSNDEIRTSILFETDKGQQKIHELGKTIDELDAKRKLHLMPFPYCNFRKQADSNLLIFVKTAEKYKKTTS